MFAALRMHRILAGLLLLAACADDRVAEYRLSGPTMGTRFNVSLVAAPGEFDQQTIQEEIYAVLEDVDRQMSTFRADSELAEFNRSVTTDWQPVSPALCSAIAEALAVSRLTGGAFDPTVAEVVGLWGFGADGAITEPPSDSAISEAMSRTGYQHLEIDCAQHSMRKTIPELRIDLSAYAKGLAVDHIAAVLDRRAVGNYLVEIGGELRMRGHNLNGEMWRIAVETPVAGGGAVESSFRITDTSVATSGDYRNFFEFGGHRYSHAISPQTGRPIAHGLAAVTVISDRAAYADALATALLVLGPVSGPELAEREDIAAYFLVRDGDEFIHYQSSAMNGWLPDD